MSDFLPDDYCLHCHQEWQQHAEGKCLFDSTSFVHDVVRSAILRNSVKEMQEFEDTECMKILNSAIDALDEKKP